MKIRLAVIGASALVFALSACGGPPPGPTPTDTGAPAPSAASGSPTAAPPSAAPSSAPPAASATTIVGSCHLGTADHSIPAIYVFYTDNADTPITISYTVFNTDGTVPTLTETVSGPVVTRISYPCVDDADNGQWTITTTAPTGGRVGCLITFGGQEVAVDSQGEGGPESATATCTGNPGI